MGGQLLAQAQIAPAATSLRMPRPQAEGEPLREALAERGRYGPFTQECDVVASAAWQAGRAAPTIARDAAPFEGALRPAPDHTRSKLREQPKPAVDPSYRDVPRWR